MSILVGIPVKDRLDLTRQVVECCRQVGGYDELVIFDNGSTDGTQAWLDAQPDLRWKDRAGVNLYAMWNEMLDLAASEDMDWVAILNNDIHFKAGFFHDLALIAASDKRIGAVCPNPPHRQIIPQPGLVEESRDLIGYAFLVSARSQLRFDTGYRWWFGDTDYARRLAARRKQILICRWIPVEHAGGASTDPHGELMRAAESEDHARFFDRWPDTAYQEHIRGWFAEHRERYGRVDA